MGRHYHALAGRRATLVTEALQPGIAAGFRLTTGIPYHVIAAAPFTQQKHGLLIDRSGRAQMMQAFGASDRCRFGTHSQSLDVNTAGGMQAGKMLQRRDLSLNYSL